MGFFSFIFGGIAKAVGWVVKSAWGVLKKTVSWAWSTLVKPAALWFGRLFGFEPAVKDLANTCEKGAQKAVKVFEKSAAEGWSHFLQRVLVLTAEWDARLNHSLETTRQVTAAMIEARLERLQGSTVQTSSETDSRTTEVEEKEVSR